MNYEKWNQTIFETYLFNCLIDNTKQTNTQYKSNSDNISSIRIKSVNQSE